MFSLRWRCVLVFVLLVSIVSTACDGGGGSGSNNRTRGENKGWIEIRQPEGKPLTVESEVLQVSGHAFVNNSLPDHCEGLNCTQSDVRNGYIPSCPPCSSGTQVTWENETSGARGTAKGALKFGGCPLGILGCEVVTAWSAQACLEPGQNSIKVIATGSNGSASEVLSVALESSEVRERPSRPVEFSVNAHNRQLHLQWAANPPGEHILHYEILLAEEEWDQWSNSLLGAQRIEPIPCCKRAVTQLSNGKEYWLALRAVNCRGTGNRTQVKPVTPQLKPATIRLSPTQDVLAVRAFRDYIAEVRDTLGEPMPGLDVDWQSTDPTVVKIARSGGTTDYRGRTGALIRATGVGTAHVTASIPGTGVTASAPVTVVRPLQSVAELLSGYNHNCVLTHSQEVLCWGWDGVSPVNMGADDIQSTPKFVTYVGSKDSLVTGYKDSCIIDKQGGASCWLTFQGNSVRSLPDLGAPIKSMDLGKYHSCAVLEDGRVKCWGENEHGQLGDGTTTSRPGVVDVVGLPGPQVSVAVGIHHTCSLSEERAIYCWGSNYWGNLGSAGANLGEPTPIDGRNNDYVVVDAGYSLTCGLRRNGKIDCWGWGLHLVNVQDHEPSDVGVEGALDMSVGVEHMCAVDGSGGLICRGESSWSRRGYPVESPLRASEKFLRVSAGNKHTCALTDNGNVMCVGSNWEGQIGDGIPRNIRDDLVFVVEPVIEPTE